MKIHMKTPVRKMWQCLKWGVRHQERKTEPPCRGGSSDKIETGNMQGDCNCLNRLKDT